MYDAQVCEDCEQLFLKPEHLKILFSGFSISNIPEHTLSYLRSLQGLKANAKKGCLLCTKFINFFKLDTTLWDGFRHEASAENSDDVVFAVCLVDMAPLVLTVSLEGVKESDSNWLAFELLTTAGRCFHSFLLTIILHQTQCL